MADSFSFGQELARGLITICSVFVGARLALKTYRSNQWWDSRHKAYQKAMETLDDCLQAAEDYKKARRVTDEPQNRARKMEAEEAFDRAASELNRLMRRGSFNMSPEARAMIEKKVGDINRISRDKRIGRTEKLDHALSHLKALCAKFSKIAIQDLQLESSREWGLRRLRPTMTALRKMRRGVASKAWKALLIFWFGAEGGNQRLNNGNSSSA